MKQLGLLIRLIIGIIAGTLIGLCGDWFGIADSTGFIAVVRAFATFTSLFSNFLTFMIPLIILSFVTVGMAELGKKEDTAEDLMRKYDEPAAGNPEVEDELAALKAKLGL